MEIKFCGAARTVTGSAHLLTLNSGYRILLDCGLFQGSKDEKRNKDWLFEARDIDCLVLSHAHIDHSGRIPRLVRDGFKGRIYSTHATRNLCSIMLLDSAYIQERDAYYYNKDLRKKPKSKKKPVRPLYETDDVMPAMERFVGVPYDAWFEIHEGVEILFRDAGHILGSATVTLRIREDEKVHLIGFSGDVGRPNRPILKDPKPMPPVDIMICESTYGDRDHESAPEDVEKLLRVIHDTCMEKKGKLIIPAFSVGRTQEIVYILDKLETAGKLPHIPVYVDSPLAVNATMIFGSHPECFDNNLHEYMLIDENPFGFNRLTYVRDVEQSKKLNHSQEPCIIISSSGMMNAGRVKHHLFHAIEGQKNTILIVGYCTDDTPGGMLRNGVEKIKLFGEWKEVRAEVKVMDSFSAHADRKELLEFLSNQKYIRQLFLVHGEEDTQKHFKELLQNNGFQHIWIPDYGETFKIGVAKK